MDERTEDREPEERRAGAHGGMPGDGAGRREEVGGSGVYPASGPMPDKDLHFTGQAGWGQGPAGPAGYEDSGSSEIHPLPGQVPDVDEGDDEGDAAEPEPLPPTPLGS